MSKYSFLVFHSEYRDFLDRIRELGVVHVIDRQMEVSENLRDQYSLAKQIQGVMRQLEKRENSPVASVEGKDGKEVFQKVNQLFAEKEHWILQRNQVTKERQQSSVWGDFSNEILDRLKEEGVNVRFYAAAAKSFNSAWEKLYPMEIIARNGGTIFFVIIHSEGEEIEIEADEVQPPERSLSLLDEELDKIAAKLVSVDQQLDGYAAGGLDLLKRYRDEIMEQIGFQHTLNNTVPEADDKVMLLEGWVPDEISHDLQQFLESSNVLYTVESPEKGDKVPVLLKNKKFAAKFEPLGELYSLPKYNELDLTPFFAPFYMVFFGFCLGDAGYGLLMVVLALLLKKRVKKELRSIMSLVFYLGLSTILFGIIGGTLFGIPLYETGVPVYSNLAAKFEARGTDINQLLFYLALVFGGIQILFGLFIKLVNEIRQFGMGFAMGTLGWILLLVGAPVMYAVSTFGEIPMEALQIPLYTLVIISGVLILFLNNLRRNVLMNVGVGLWNTYNMITGILGDLLSYIRLFALGISSAIMGFVFNSLALEMSGSVPVLNIIIMVIILVIGHGINIFMSGLGAFVHPMRLTFVEFYKNAGFNGGGKRYNPFRKII